MAKECDNCQYLLTDITWEEGFNDEEEWEIRECAEHHNEFLENGNEICPYQKEWQARK